MTAKIRLLAALTMWIVALPGIAVAADTVGAVSRLQNIDTFVFDRNSRRSLATSVEGAFRFVSGQLSNGSGTTVTVQTPLAIISVRGTDFWGGPIDAAYGVFLIEGAVTVTTQGGEVTLDEPGTGTTITAADAPPGEVVVWPQEKVGRALAATSFQ